VTAWSLGTARGAVRATSPRLCGRRPSTAHATDGSDGRGPPRRGTGSPARRRDFVRGNPGSPAERRGRAAAPRAGMGGVAALASGVVLRRGSPLVRSPAFRRVVRPCAARGRPG
jgi:hypothetical protein